MIPIVVFKNPFLTWVLISALLYSGLFWVYYSGLLWYVLGSDFTHIASVLLGILIYCNLSLGIISYKLQQMIYDEEAGTTSNGSSYLYTLFDTIGMFMFISPTLGLLGTVIGLSRLMKDAATVNIDTIVELLGTGTGAALFPTAMGLVLVVVLTVQRFIPMHSFRIHGLAREL